MSVRGARVAAGFGFTVVARFPGLAGGRGPLWPRRRLSVCEANGAGLMLPAFGGPSCVRRSGRLRRPRLFGGAADREIGVVRPDPALVDAGPEPEPDRSGKMQSRLAAVQDDFAPFP